MKLQPIKQCRVCSSKKLVFILSLGEQYVSDFVKKPDRKGPTAPLELVLCMDCYLLQLKHNYPKEHLYRNYWYISGMNKTMRDALADITTKAKELIKLNDKDIVIDIGSNDSTLLRSYKLKGIEMVGFEPAKNIMDLAHKDFDGIIINDFFSYEGFKEAIRRMNRQEDISKARIITSIACFYDLEDPNTFVDDVRKSLAEDGIWINQLSYTPTVFDTNAFDSICHEHLEYYTLYSMENLLNKHELEIFDVDTNDINGGSFRLYIKHKGAKIEAFAGAESRVKRMREFEEKNGYLDIAIYKQFADRVRKLKGDIHSFVENEVKNGKKIYVYGASTKGNTLLQYCDLDNKLIAAAADRNSGKFGLYTIGTNIPIISEEQARKEKPDFFLVLPWAFIKEFRERERDFYKNGGRFIVPLPEIRIVE